MCTSRCQELGLVTNTYMYIYIYYSLPYLLPCRIGVVAPIVVQVVLVFVNIFSGCQLAPQAAPKMTNGAPFNRFGAAKKMRDASLIFCVPFGVAWGCQLAHFALPASCVEWYLYILLVPSLCSAIFDQGVRRHRIFPERV